MKKNIFYLILLVVLMVPFIDVRAASQAIVHNQDELKNALSNNEITNIILDSDINTTEKINITRPVTIDGRNHTVEYVGTFDDNGSKDNKIWKGIYIFQVYKSSATFKDIKLTGGNAAILVNGSTIKLEGTVDVSGNGFGGIELSQGKGVTDVSTLKLDKDTNLVNTTENRNAPTLWVPDDSKDAIIEMDGLVRTINSGDELVLEEIENMFEVPTNPTTADYLGIAFVIGLASVVTIIYSTKKMFN